VAPGKETYVYLVKALVIATLVLSLFICLRSSQPQSVEKKPLTSTQLLNSSARLSVIETPLISFRKPELEWCSKF